MSGEMKLLKMPNCLKEKIKRWHDKRILKREFTVGDKVLLYRSHLRIFAGKLLSKWEGPFIIEEVYHSGAIKINSLDGDKPQVVNGQRLKHYIFGDPIGKDIDIIQVVTPEDFIKSKYQKESESELD